MLRKLIAIGLILLVVVVTAYFMAFGLPRSKGSIPVEKETTFFTEPLDEEGYVDYAAAVNDRASKGVTPDNNAMVLLWGAIGPQPDGPEAPAPSDEYWRLLGIERPAARGDYFVPLDAFAEANVADGLRLIEVKQVATTTPRSVWKATDWPEVAEWLKHNEKPLAIAVEASRRRRYYSPLVPHDENGTLHGLFTAPPRGVVMHRAMGRCLLIRGMLRAGNGDVDGAWGDILAAHRLGRIIGRGLTLYEGLSGLGLQKEACHATLVLLEHTRPGPKRLASLLADLNTLPPPAGLADTIDLAERAIVLDLLQRAHRGGPSYLGRLGRLKPAHISFFSLASSELDLVPTMRKANEWFDRLASAFRARTWAEREEQWGNGFARRNLICMEADSWWSVGQRLFGNSASRGNHVGLVLLGLLLPNGWGVLHQPDLTQQRYDNLRVAIALEMYHHDHKAYPKTLSDLAPKFLPSVPAGVFSGKALHYELGKTGYRLYTRGPDGRDEYPAPDDLKEGEDDGTSFVVVRMHWTPPEPKLDGLPGGAFPGAPP